MRAVAYADGGNRGCPGHHACAVVMKLETGDTAEATKYLGPQGSNNSAEWGSLILALEMARELKITDLTVRMDSRLVVEQALGHWQVKKPHLKPLRDKAQILAADFPSVRIDHIPREQNTAADALCTKLLDQVTGRARRA